jgi:hypothetical protein
MRRHCKGQPVDVVEGNTVYCENRVKHVDTARGQSTVLNVNVSGAVQPLSFGVLNGNVT